jgi:antigen flippase
VITPLGRRDSSFVRLMPTTSNEPIPQAVTNGGSETDPALERTHRQILRSSAIIGGSSAANIVVGMVRTKAMAFLLGPNGFGMLSMYTSLLNLSQMVASLGVSSSGVRQIAEAASAGDETSIAQTVMALRRASLFVALTGSLALILLSRPISNISYGTIRYSPQVAGLSIALFFTLISAGQAALINGVRRIGDLAKMNVAGAVIGTLASILLVYVFRDRGIILSIIAVSATACFVSWRYSRKIKLPRITFGAAESYRAAVPMFRLGLAFMVTNAMTVGVSYAVRTSIYRRLGPEPTGLYQAAWTLGSLYVSFILQAMAADFYPRLTTFAQDHPASNRIVNEQVYVGLLLAGPGVLATVTLAPLVLSVFYSTRFGSAVHLLRWICLGTMIQVATWPLGYIVIAQARRRLFIGCELAWSIVSLLLAWICIRQFGLTGAGIAFFGSYIFHAGLIYTVARKCTGFRWADENVQLGTALFFLTAVVCIALYTLPSTAGVTVGVSASLLAALYCGWAVIVLIPDHPLSMRLHAFVTGIQLRWGRGGQV